MIQFRKHVSIRKKNMLTKILASGLIEGTGQDSSKSFNKENALHTMLEISAAKSFFTILLLVLLIAAIIVFFSLLHQDNSKTIVSGVITFTLFITLTGSILYNQASVNNSDSNNTTISIVEEKIGLDFVYNDLEHEFKEWAKARYGVELTDDQLTTLELRKEWRNNLSDASFIDGKFIRSWSEGNTMTLVTGDSKKDIKELETVHDKQ